MRVLRHMLNIFPIQFLAPLAYTLLRVAVGVLLIRIGIIRIKHRTPNSLIVATKVSFPPSILLIVGFLEIIAGAFLFVGLYTQIAALITLFFSFLHVLFPKRLSGTGIPPRIFFVLLFFVSLSLFITGAGAFAFDLPI